MKILSVGAELFHTDIRKDGRADRRAEGMTKLIVVFRYTLLASEIKGTKFSTCNLLRCGYYGQGCAGAIVVECVWNLMEHGDARERKWRENWRMGWVASTLTLRRNVVYPALITLMRTPRLPAVDWTDAPDDLNGLVSFGERRNLVSARVPSRFRRSLPHTIPPIDLGIILSLILSLRLRIYTQIN